MQSYLGLTLLDVEPNRREDVEHGYTQKKLRLESRVGKFSEENQGETPRVARRFHWFLDGLVQVNAFRTFLSDHQGRLVPFWVPTWHRDLLPAQTRLGSDNDLIIQRVGYTRYQYHATEKGRRHLCRITGEGAGVGTLRSVVSATEGPTTETLVLSAIHGTAVALSDFWSFLTLCRLAQDDVRLHWHTPTFAEAEMDIIELPDETP